jgi:REP element-mobilizing transposase RayT
VITANRNGEELRDALKAVACRALNKKFGKRTWWAEGGSSKYLWEQNYFDNSVDYVHRQRAF